jgi:hypothetical protein
VNRKKRKDAMKNKKRILSVTIKRMIDEDPDTSWLGEYGQSSTSEFSIDREHTLECPVNSPNTIGQNWLARIRKHIVEGSIEWVWSPEEVLDDIHETLDTCSDSLYDCDCGESGDMQRHEYRYFNPSFNYVDKNGHALPENTPEEVRSYVRQDYERMESANRGDWGFIGIRTECEVNLPYQVNKGCVKGREVYHNVKEVLSSGGLWGIESDSEDSYLESVEKDELADLRSQLKMLGFSSRAISTAFKTIERKDQ